MKSDTSLAGFGLFLIIMAVSFAGCDTPTPLSAIPSVVYYFAANESRVYVTGDDYMYEGINISFNGSSRTENFTYGLTHNTSKLAFQLEVRILDNTSTDDEIRYERYTYSATVRVEVKEDSVTFHIIDNNNEKEIERKAPYSTLMERAS